jgi:hypothetical protein
MGAPMTAHDFGVGRYVGDLLCGEIQCACKRTKEGERERERDRSREGIEAPMISLGTEQKERERERCFWGLCRNPLVFSLTRLKRTASLPAATFPMPAASVFLWYLDTTVEISATRARERERERERGREGERKRLHNTKKSFLRSLSLSLFLYLFLSFTHRRFSLLITLLRRMNPVSLLASAALYCSRARDKERAERASPRSSSSLPTYEAPPVRCRTVRSAAIPIYVYTWRLGV